MNCTVIHQPDFMPYLGFLQRFMQSSLWIVLDDAQYVSGTSNSWMNRDLVKGAQGKRWLTVGVQKPRLGTPIHEVLLAQTSWRDDNLNLIRECYRKAPFFGEIMPEVEELYRTDYHQLIDFNMASIDFLCRKFAINIPRVMASSLHVAGKSNERLVGLLQQTKSSHYLSGNGARDYFNPEPFAAAGIEVHWQQFRHPVYPQLHGDFIAGLSSLDLLFNCGAERGRHILRELA